MDQFDIDSETNLEKWDRNTSEVEQIRNAYTPENIR